MASSSSPRIVFTPLEEDLFKEVKALQQERDQLNEIIRERDEYIFDLQNRLFQLQGHNHYVTSRLAAISQADKVERPHLLKMVEDLTKEKNEMMESIERLEKELSALKEKKKSFFKFF